MLVGNGFNIRHIKESDLEALIPLLNDLKIRGDYLPSMMISPQTILQQYRDNGLSSEEFERLLIVDNEEKNIGNHLAL